MMSQSNPAAGLMPLPLPDTHTERMLLFAIRRMAAHGIRDAHAAMIMLDLFGGSFRRPLVLLRAFMLEFAQASHRTIRLAPCCSLRMTAHEAELLAALRTAPCDPAAGERALIALSGNPCMCEPLSAAVVLGGVIARRVLSDERPRRAWTP